MTWCKRLVVAALVRLYPARWKREYGEEFADVLMARPLGASTILNTLWNSFCQQLRFGEPWVIVGVPWLVLLLTEMAWNILYPSPYVVDSFKGEPGAAIVGFLIPFGVGYWTVTRDPLNGRGGSAAMKNSFLITWPWCALAILQALGILTILTLGPGDIPTTFHEHGFAYTLYDQTRRPTFWFPLFALPLIQLPLVGLFGWIGGKAARLTMRRRRA